MSGTDWMYLNSLCEKTERLNDAICRNTSKKNGYDE